MAHKSDGGFLMESATWRAAADWGARLGYSEGDMAEANRQSIALLVDLRRLFESERSPMVISGCVGPRGDGYRVEDAMTVERAQAYHDKQIDVFGTTAADKIGRESWREREGKYV